MLVKPLFMIAGALALSGCVALTTHKAEPFEFYDSIPTEAAFLVRPEHHCVVEEFEAKVDITPGSDGVFQPARKSEHCSVIFDFTLDSDHLLIRYSAALYSLDLVSREKTRINNDSGSRLELPGGFHGHPRADNARSDVVAYVESLMNAPLPRWGFTQSANIPWYDISGDGRVLAMLVREAVMPPASNELLLVIANGESKNILAEIKLGQTELTIKRQSRVAVSDNGERLAVNAASGAIAIFNVSELIRDHAVEANED